MGSSQVPHPTLESKDLAKGHEGMLFSPEESSVVSIHGAPESAAWQGTHHPWRQQVQDSPHTHASQQEQEWQEGGSRRTRIIQIY